MPLTAESPGVGSTWTRRKTLYQPTAGSTRAPTAGTRWLHRRFLSLVTIFPGGQPFTVPVAVVDTPGATQEAASTTPSVWSVAIESMFTVRLAVTCTGK